MWLFLELQQFFFTNVVSYFLKNWTNKTNEYLRRQYIERQYNEFENIFITIVFFDDKYDVA